MINFQLSDEQVALQEMVRKFVEKEVVPVAGKFDESGEFPKKVIANAWELGIMNGCIPQKFGGLGLGVLEDVIINEELGAGCLGITTSICVNNLGLYPIVLFGTDRQIEEFAAPFLKTPDLVSFCLTEPSAGS